MKLLLHACCGPCSLEPVRLLQEAGHDITIAYMNSNIAPADEYQHRLSTLLEWAKSQGIPVIEGPYEPERWQEAIREAWKPGSKTGNQSDKIGNPSDAKSNIEPDVEYEAESGTKIGNQSSDIEPSTEHGTEASTKIGNKPTNNSLNNGFDNDFANTSNNDSANSDSLKGQNNAFCHEISAIDNNLDISHESMLPDERTIKSPGKAAVFPTLKQKAPNAGKAIFEKTKTAAITTSITFVIQNSPTFTTTATTAAELVIAFAWKSWRTTLTIMDLTRSAQL